MNNKVDFKKYMKMDVIILVLCLVIGVIHPYVGSIAFSIFWFILIVEHRDFLAGFMGKLGVSNKNYSKAVSWYKTAAFVTSSKPKYIQNYVYCEIKYGDTEKAAKNLDRILEMRSKKNKFKTEELISVYLIKSLLEWKMNEIDKSIETLNAAVEMDKENLTTKTSLAYMKLIKAGQTGDATEAYEYAKELYTLNPSDFYSKSMFALSSYLVDDKNTAEEILGEIYEGMTNIPDNFYFYGRILEEKGDYQKAYDSLSRGKKLLPKTIIRMVELEHYDELIAKIEENLEKVS